MTCTTTGQKNLLSLLPSPHGPLHSYPPLDVSCFGPSGKRRNSDQVAGGLKRGEDKWSALGGRPLEGDVLKLRFFWEADGF